MEWKGICDQIFMIRERLQDEQSKILFDARLHYSITGDKWQLYKTVDLIEKEWHCPVLEEFVNQSKGKGIVVWGCGHDGREAKRTLDVCRIHLDYFCDSNSEIVGTEIDGVRVISVNEMFEKCADYSIIIGSSKYREEMNKVLLEHGFHQSNIFSINYGHLQANTGKRQYFDVFKAEQREVYVDAGAYNGGTILDFVRWTNGKYHKVIALEPLSYMHSHIKKVCEENELHNIEIHEVAAWNKKERLFFTEDQTGSKVEDKGGIVVTGMDVDSIVKDDKVTFIKMDIEGSELKALEGARKTIQRNHPKLAISIYHKPEDIVELPVYILELVPEYKFYIRHYCSDLCETVLYGYIG